MACQTFAEQVHQEVPHHFAKLERERDVSLLASTYYRNGGWAIFKVKVYCDLFWNIDRNELGAPLLVLFEKCLTVNVSGKSGSDADVLVGTARFELATPCTPSKCATRLRYVPTESAAQRRQRGVDLEILHQRCARRPAGNEQ
jgi:hypothetical protein